MKKLRIPVYFYALTAMLFWGMSFVWSSILLKYYQPITIIFIRLIISSFFLFSVIYLTRQQERILRKDLFLVILSAVFNPFLYFLGENYGLKYSSSTVAAVIIATIPVFSPIVGFVSYRERLRWFNLAGILLSFTGIIVMLAGNGISLKTGTRGILFLFGAVSAALAYSVTLKKLAEKYRPLSIIFWQNLAGIFLFLPLFLFFESAQAASVPLNQSIVISFLCLAILASSLSFVFYAKSVQVLGISKSNIFSNLIPVFTAIFSFFILGETFNLPKVIGILVVIGGVYISEIGKKGS